MNPDQPIKTRWIRVLSYLGAPGTTVRKDALKVEREVASERAAFILESVHVYTRLNLKAPKSLEKLMLRALRFRKQKALVKKLIQSIFTPWIILSCLIFPTIFCFKYFNFCERYNWFISFLIWLAGIVLCTFTLGTSRSISTYFSNIQNRITKIGNLVVDFLLMGILHGITWFLFINCNTTFDLIILIAFLSATIFFDCVFLMFFLADNLIDIYYYSQKVRLTDELILESTFSLANNKDWPEIFRKRNRRNNALSEIERLASLIENDWSSHIQVGDAKTEKWKQQTLKGIAAGIRKLKRELIIPSPESAKILTARFNQLFESLLTHNLQGFIQEDVPAERVRKKSVLQPIKQFLVALIPITAAIVIYKYEPDLLPENYNGLPMIIGSGWLILCLLLWLDPQIGDKVSLLRNGKNIFSHRSDSSDD